MSRQLPAASCARARTRSQSILAELGFDAGELVAAEAVVARALSGAEVECIALAPDDPLLAGAVAVLDRDAGAIWVRDDLSPSERSLTIAHELGHWWLHPTTALFRDDPATTGASGEIGGFLAEIDGYSPVQRAEAEAQAFAAELCMPGMAVSRAFRAGLAASEIADRLGVGVRAVTLQLVAHVLDGVHAGPEIGEESCPQLDADQLKACAVSGGPTLVKAGPGTGKTTALVGRVMHLLRRGVAPQNVLALTFSRNAAEELRGRLCAAPEPSGEGNVADLVRVFTVHAFGLEALRAYGDRLGLSSNPCIVTPVRAMALLEERLEAVGLDQLLCIEEPTLRLADVLKRIAYWKGAGMTPDEVSRTNGESPELAEYARAFRSYEEILRDRRAVDFADLLGLTIKLLSEHEDVRRSICSNVEHLLVDEVQDLSRAGVTLIGMLAGAGAELWMVGDPAQSIYAFRGASWDDLFHGDGLPEPRQVFTLSQNYRSSQCIVKALKAYSEKVGLSADGQSSAIPSTLSTDAEFAVAADEHAQLRGIVDTVRRRRSEGLALSEQAVLCRTNAQCVSLTASLTAAGVPVRGPASALQMQPVQDAVVWLARAAGAPRAAPAPDGGASLADEVRPHGRVTDMLGAYLFGPQGIVRSLADTASSELGALSWLFRAVARSEWEVIEEKRSRARETDGGRGCVEDGAAASYPATPLVAERVIGDLRRALLLREDRCRLEAGRRDDAIAVMTVHAAKGLEFDAVYVPFLNRGRFPPRSRHVVLSDPDLPSASETDASEEDRLLYVALSRARRYVTVSCCERLSGRRASQSVLAEPARHAILAAGGRAVAWNAHEGSETGDVAWTPPHDDPDEPVNRRSWYLADLDQYVVCPRRYHLSRSTPSVAQESSGYGAYVHAMRRVVRAIQQRALSSHTDAALNEALEVWEEAWARHGSEARFAAVYRSLGERAIREAVSSPTLAVGDAGVVLELALDGGTIHVTADRVAVDGHGCISVERFRYRKPPARPKLRDGTLLLALAARERWPEAELSVGDRYVVGDTVVWYRRDSRRDSDALERYERAIAGIRAQRFPPKPSEWCPQCPCLFACPGREDA